MPLRTKLALLLVLAIVSVVLLASVAAISVIGGPRPDRQIEPIARQIHLIVELVESQVESGAVSTIPLMAEPLPGPADPATGWLRAVLARTGPPLDVVVTREDRPGPGHRDRLMVSVPIGDHGWIALPLAERPPPPFAGWPALVTWMLVIILGTTAVALFAANMMTRPLRLIEGAVASVGPDGVLPELPEKGSAELRATARALNRLTARLRSAMESRMRLVAAAGHDLRTPMTRMRLRAEFLPEEERGQWLGDLDELDRIADSAIRLVREEAETEATGPLALGALLRQVGTELAELGLPAAIGETAAAEVRAAPLALKRAIRNLVINAATHGRGARVSLAVVGGEAVVTIDDDGPGIPEGLLERVFEPFFRVDPARRQAVPGAGLGLAIAREIIGRFGGRITIANRAGGGLRQTVALPLA